MEIKIIACGVFEPYLDTLKRNTNDTVDILFLDAGLHEYPDKLRQTVQQEIDRISAAKEDWDVIVLYYGLCGRGTCELESREIPVMIPCVHDCIALFMGSDSAYKREFAKNPGTFYHTLGWLQKKINPNEMAAVDLYRNYDLLGWDKHPEYEALDEKYGSHNAEYILKFAASWQKNYTCGAYIDLGFDEAEYAEQTKVMAEAFGWNYRYVKGDMSYMTELFRAAETDRVFILPPFSVSKATGDDRIFTAVSAEEGASLYYETETQLMSEGEAKAPSGIGLGIDAGGTYTDAVIYDFAERKILAKAKSLTTYEDLLKGISSALSKLPAEELKRVKITSLSTTLATNSIVEGKGAVVGTILYSPFEWFARQADLKPCIQVKGALDISGSVLENTDEAQVLAAAEELVEKYGCQAIAVGGYASLRNPELSVRIKSIIHSRYPDLSVVCSHEISQKLNAVNSLKTAAANARLIPVINSLISSVKKALTDYGISGKLMIVKGDGTCVNTDTALLRPIETVLSGPASSVSGARLLTGISDAIVADVGGTTTDIAVIRNGHVDISYNGASVGDAVMQINAVKISTSGLGGDSRIAFTRDRRLTIGPMRNIPICMAADEYPFIADRLSEIASARHQSVVDSSLLDILIYDSSCKKRRLSEDERRLCELLENKRAVFASEAKEELGLASVELLHIPALEAIGAIRRAHLTPTDIFHIQGKMNKWNTAAAVNAFGVFADLLGVSRDELMTEIWSELRYMLVSQLFSRILTDEMKVECTVGRELEYILRSVCRGTGNSLSFGFSLPYPLIAVGAPVRDLFEGFDKYIGSRVVIPDDADVANAAGAVSGEIISHEAVYIRQGAEANYVIYSSERRLEENTLSGATDTAVKLCRRLAMEKSRKSGASDPSVVITVKDKVSRTADGGLLFIERVIAAACTASALGD